jgi:hypothetical protein
MVSKRSEVVTFKKAKAIPAVQLAEKIYKISCE